MLALMLDPCYKCLWVVENYVRCGNVIQFASEYDMQEVISLLNTNFERLNLSI